MGTGTFRASHKDTQTDTHREKDNTLARKPTGSHYVGGSTVTHIYTLHFILKSQNQLKRADLALLNSLKPSNLAMLERTTQQGRNICATAFLRHQTKKHIKHTKKQKGYEHTSDKEVFKG